MTRVAVINDFRQVAQGAADWSALPDDVELEFFHEYVRDADRAAALLEPFDVVGSSRVDLQACKLEYSIVSPK